MTGARIEYTVPLTEVVVGDIWTQYLGQENLVEWVGVDKNHVLLAGKVLRSTGDAVDWVARRPTLDHYGKPMTVNVIRMGRKAKLTFKRNQTMGQKTLEALVYDGGSSYVIAPTYRYGQLVGYEVTANGGVIGEADKQAEARNIAQRHWENEPDRSS